jgi:chromosome segregation protein
VDRRAATLGVFPALTVRAAGGSVFLRSLSLRGFKSFADATVLEVEPGITVIVGPNGSGKSNVVDGLAWVLGTHSAKKVRGAAMADVIFAGSPTRSRANQARVEIQIDNADGRLGAGGPGTADTAAAFREIRIARTIHRDGETGYEINGEPVRALDVQELLSDAGLGRELHTIVGQGQLDEILNAKPEERRRYIEEAAGILKHRRRRERALRKLEQVDAHIDKLRTVLRELRRQLRPLERQAEAADRYQALQAELRTVRVQLVACELDRVTRLAGREGEDEAAAAAAQQQVAARLAAVRERERAVEGELAQLGPATERAQSTYYRLTSLAERLKGTADLVDARRRHLVEYVEEPLAGRPPAELRGQADRLDADRTERERQVVQERARLERASAGRRGAEQARRAHELDRQAERRRRAEQRERVLRWEGEVSARRGSIAAAEADAGRVAASLDTLDTRATAAAAEVARVEAEIRDLDAREVELTAALETAEEEVASRRERLEELDARRRDLTSRRASHAARAQALRAALAESDGGTAALLAAAPDGLLGSVAMHVRVEAGADAAVAAALGPLGEGVVARDRDRAGDAIAWLRATAAGVAIVLPTDAAAGGALDTGDDPFDGAPDLRAVGAVPVGALLVPAEGSPHGGEVVDALRRVLARTFVVPDWTTALELHRRAAGLTFVTREGDLAGPHGYRGGGAPERSAVTTATAAADAETAVETLTAALGQLATERAVAADDLAAAERVLAAATERINASDARITGAAERLGRLHQELHALEQQAEVFRGQQRELGDLLERDRAALSELHGRGPQAPDDDVDDEPDPVADDLDADVERAREHELDARVALERAGEQVRHLEAQAATLREEAEQVERALAEAARRRELRRQGIARCGELALVTRAARTALERSIATAADRRDAVQAQVGRARADRAAIRDELARVRAELDELREVRHAAELRRAELTRRLEALGQRARSELSLSLEEVRAEHPDVTGVDPEALGAREDELVRKVGLLGRVNPLALEEFKALEERHAFLSDQLDDLRRSKRDLGEVVVAVDTRIREVFREAFDDVAREFAVTFETVFPGGHGRLVLTDPEDLLTTGIEVEARPPGKRITRLSLLSGGERSLTVLAFVFAIFRARPSPFYVLDEVDAALDDVNLQRLLRVVRSFRGHAQVILVTHQKRSMEIADVLYGITMGPDAVTKAVAERLREPSAAARHDVLEDRASDAPTAALDPGDLAAVAVGASPTHATAGPV